MGIFDKLKGRISGRKGPEEEYGSEVREAVLGYPPAPPAPEYPSAPRPRFEERAPPEYEPIDRPERRFERYPGEREFSPELPELPGREPERREEPGTNYEILDRLRIIETQLATIRAQTETINERLKSLELQLRVRRPSYY